MEQISADDLVAFFIPKSSAEQWLLTNSSDELYLIMQEAIGIYKSVLPGQEEDQSSNNNVVNIIFAIINKNLSTDESKVRLSSLQLLLHLSERYLDIIQSEFISPLFIYFQGLLQDSSRLIRQTTLILAATIVTKTAFNDYIRNLIEFVGSTYKYHENSLKLLCLGLLSVIVNENDINGFVGSALEERSGFEANESLIKTVVDSIIRMAKYSITLLVYSSTSASSSQQGIEQEHNEYRKESLNDENKSESLSTNLQLSHDAAADLIALCSITLAAMDEYKAIGSFSIVNIQRTPGWALLDHLLDIVEHLPIPKSFRSEILSRLGSWHFTSLDDEDINQLVPSLTYKPKKVHPNDDVSGKKSLIKSCSIPNDISQSLVDTPSREAHTADGSLLRSLLHDEGGAGEGSRGGNNDGSNAVRQTPTRQLIDNHLANSNIQDTPSPLKLLDNATNSNYQRAASARVKRSRLKAPLRIDKPQESDTDKDGDRDGGEISPSQYLISSSEQQGSPVSPLVVRGGRTERGVDSPLIAPALSSPSQALREQQPQQQPLHQEFSFANLIEDSLQADTSQGSLHYNQLQRVESWDSNYSVGFYSLGEDSVAASQQSESTPTKKKKQQQQQQQSNQRLSKVMENDSGRSDSFSQFQQTQQQQQTQTQSTTVTGCAVPVMPVMPAQFPRITRSPRSSHKIVGSTQASPSSSSNSNNSSKLSPRSPRSPRKGGGGHVLGEYPDASEAYTGGKIESVVYTETADLLPLSVAGQEFNKALRGIEIQDWPELFNTLNIVRRAVIHHPSMVVQSGELHSIVTYVMKHVAHLRSALAKNALLTIADMFTTLKKSMDPELTTVMPGLMKRCSDTSNGFLEESADRVMDVMIDNATPSRVLTAFLPFTDHKNAMVRTKTARGLLLLTKAKLDDSQFVRDIDGMLARLPRLVQDQMPEARQFSRETIQLLLKYEVVPKAHLEAMIGLDVIEKACKDLLVAKGLSLKSPQRGAGKGASQSQSQSQSSSFYQQQQQIMQQSLKGAQSLSKEDGDLPRLSHMHVRARDSSHGTQDEEEQGNDETKAATLSQAVESTPQKGRKTAGLTPSTPPVKRASAAKNSRSSQYRPVNSSHGTGDEDQQGQVDAAAMIESNEDYIPAVPRSSTKSSVKGSSSSSSSKAMAVAKRVMDSDPELQSWQSTVAACAASTGKSWMDRKEAMTKVTDLLLKHATVLRDLNKVDACLDCLLDRLEEGAIKLVAHSLDCLERIASQSLSLLSDSAILAAPRMLTAVASSNKQISARAAELLKTTLSECSALQVAQFLCGAAEHEKDKQRIAAMKVLLDLIEIYCSSPDLVSLIVKKIIFVSAGHIVFEETKPDVRLAAMDIVKAIQTHCEEPVWRWAETVKHQEEIKRITVGL